MEDAGRGEEEMEDGEEREGEQEVEEGRGGGGGETIDGLNNNGLGRMRS